MGQSPPDPPSASSACRRRDDVVAGSELIFAVRRLAPDGLAAWAQIIGRGYEGLVAKDERSVYRAARRARG
jgi:ATP-dependent DNA ligase